MRKDSSEKLALLIATSQHSKIRNYFPDIFYNLNTSFSSNFRKHPQQQFPVFQKQFSEKLTLFLATTKDLYLNWIQEGSTGMVFQETRSLQRYLLSSPQINLYFPTDVIILRVHCYNFNFERNHMGKEKFIQTNKETSTKKSKT